MKIIIDTREQTPWAFPPDLAETARGTLQQGDYALEGDDAFAIERKSLSDFLGTISTGWKRFLRELSRMDNAGFPSKVIIVEGNASSCFFAPDGTPPTHDHAKLSPQFIAKRVAQLAYDSHACILFAGSPEIASGLAVQIFRRRQRALDNED